MYVCAQVPSDQQLQPLKRRQPEVAPAEFVLKKARKPANYSEVELNQLACHMISTLLKHADDNAANDSWSRNCMQRARALRAELRATVRTEEDLQRCLETRLQNEVDRPGPLSKANVAMELARSLGLDDRAFFQQEPLPQSAAHSNGHASACMPSPPVHSAPQGATTPVACAARSIPLDEPQLPGPRWTRHVNNRALTAAEVVLVDGYLSSDGNPLELLAQLNDIPVTREKMLCLRPGEWLNDEVINFFMELLKGRTAARSGAAAAAASASGAASGEAALPRVHFFNTLFYAKLTKDERGYDYSGVKRWTRKNKLFEQDMLVCPVHVHGNHWVLAVVNFRDKRFEYYDSLKGSEGQCLKNLRKYLKDESLDKLKATWDDTGWTDHNFRDGTPQQRNGWDCGVFMCKTADYLSQEGKLEFTQQDMDYFRRRLVVEIRNSQLLEDQDAQ